jgi:hypothetical protein
MTKLEWSILAVAVTICAALIWSTVHGAAVSVAMRSAGQAMVTLGYFLIGSAG